MTVFDRQSINNFFVGYACGRLTSGLVGIESSQLSGIANLRGKPSKYVPRKGSAQSYESLKSFAFKKFEERMEYDNLDDLKDILEDAEKKEVQEQQELERKELERQEREREKEEEENEEPFEADEPYESESYGTSLEEPESSNISPESNASDSGNSNNDVIILANKGK